MPVLWLDNVMIRSIYSPPIGALKVNLSPSEFVKALQEIQDFQDTKDIKDTEGLLWVDLVGEPAEVCEPILREIFGFHPLSIDDALQEIHIPKLDDWHNYLYLVLHGVILNMQAEKWITTLELDLFVGQHYIVTHQGQPIAAIERVWSAYKQDERYIKQGSSYLLYRLADELVATYMPVMETIDDAIDQVEDELFKNVTANTLENIFMVKRALLHLYRIIIPQQQVLDKLSRDPFTVIHPQNQIYFRDVYDHLVRLHGITESMRDLTSGVLNTYLSVVNNRMNNVMKMLTIITALFMPLSFIVGFFGMNFFQPTAPLESWTGKTAFIIAMSVMIALPFGMYLWMRRRGWM